MPEAERTGEHSLAYSRSHRTENAALPLLRAPELAKACGLSTRVIYSWVSQQVIPPDLIIRAGRAVYFRRAVLDWLAGNGAAPPSSPSS